MEHNPFWKFNSTSASQEIPLPQFYGTWSSITVFTAICHSSTFWVRWIQKTTSDRVSVRYTLIAYSYRSLGLPSKLFPSGLSHCRPYLPHAPPTTPFLISPLYYFVTSTNHEAQHYVIFPLPCHLVPPKPKYRPQYPVLEHLQPVFFSWIEAIFKQLLNSKTIVPYILIFKLPVIYFKTSILSDTKHNLLL